VLSSLCLFGCRGLGVGVVVDVGDWIGMEDGAVGMMGLLGCGWERRFSGAILFVLMDLSGWEMGVWEGIWFCNILDGVYDLLDMCDGIKGEMGEKWFRYFVETFMFFVLRMLLGNLY